jgi:AraC family transcriptional activator of mtrCDE
MDALSQLMALGRVQVAMDVQCRLSGAYLIPHATAAQGEAPFHFVMSGHCQLRTQQGVFELKPGDFFLLPHGDAHDVLSHATAGALRGAPKVRAVGRASALPLKANVASTRTAELDLLCGRFLSDPSVGALFLGALPQMLQVNLLGTTTMATLQPMMELLRHEASHALPGATEIVSALGQAILTLALREFGVAESGQSHWLTLLSDARLGPSIQAVLEHPGGNWTVDTLGKRVAMSRATYARQFQRKAGMSVGEFLLCIRMMKACDLIKHSRRGLSDIGQSVGYQSEAAFGKAFQKVLGETPGRWRRSQQAS